MPTQRKLPAFEGSAVRKSTIRITKAGDGLSEALELEPIALHVDDEVFYVLTGKVTQVNHKKVEDNVIRVHTVEAKEISAIDAVTARDVIQTEQERLSTLRDEQTGQMRISDTPRAVVDFDDDGDGEGSGMVPDGSDDETAG